MRTSSKHPKTFSGLLTSMQGGLNRAMPPYAIGDEQLIDATNFYYDPLSGYPTTRPGLKKYSTAAAGSPDASPVWAGYSCVIAGTSYDLIACEDGGLYYLDTDKIPQIIDTLSGSKKPTFSVLNDMLVIASGGVIQTWDGNTAHTLTDRTSESIDFISDYATKDVARIIGLGNTTYPDRTWHCASIDPTDWTAGATPESDAKYADIGYKDGLSLVGVGSLLGNHYYFKRNAKGHRRIYAANTTLPSVNWQIIEATRVNSSLSAHFIKEVNNKLHFVDIEGPKTVSPQPAWDKPFPVDKSGVLIAPTIRPYIAADGFSVVDPVFGLLMIKPGRNVDTWFCLDTTGERWTYFQYVTNIQSGWYNGEKMLFGASDGYVYEYDTSSCLDNGTEYRMTVETKWFNKDPMNLEILKRIMIDLIGLVAGTATIQIKSKGAVLGDSIQQSYDQGWWAWSTVNSITPENWTESLDKSVMFTMEDDEHRPADMMSVAITITGGLCSLIGIYADIGNAGKGER